MALAPVLFCERVGGVQRSSTKWAVESTCAGSTPAAVKFQNIPSSLSHISSHQKNLLLTAHSKVSARKESCSILPQSPLKYALTTPNRVGKGGYLKNESQTFDEVPTDLITTSVSVVSVNDKS